MSNPDRFNRSRKAMQFETTIYAPTPDEPLWCLSFDSPHLSHPQNQWATPEKVGRYVGMQMSNGSVNASVVEANGETTVCFEGDSMNFLALQEVLLWLGNPSPFST